MNEFTSWGSRTENKSTQGITNGLRDYQVLCADSELWEEQTKPWLGVRSKREGISTGGMEGTKGKKQPGIIEQSECRVRGLNPKDFTHHPRVWALSIIERSNTASEGGWL